MVSALIKEFDGGCSGSRGVYRVPLFNEILAQRIGHYRLVVYHKNSHLFVFHLLLLSGNRRTLRGHLLLLLHKYVVSRGCYRKAEAVLQNDRPPMLPSRRGPRLSSRRAPNGSLRYRQTSETDRGPASSKRTTRLSPRHC